MTEGMIYVATDTDKDRETQDFLRIVRKLFFDMLSVRFRWMMQMAWGQCELRN